MNRPLSLAEARNRLHGLKMSVCRKECWSCDCLQGLLTQLELDCPEIADEVQPLQLSAADMHGCLGCDPCPPGEVFSEYLRWQNESACESHGRSEAKHRAQSDAVCGESGDTAGQRASNSGHNDIRDRVRGRYAEIAASDDGSCCSSKSCCSPDALGQPDASAKLGYSDDDRAAVPEGANMGLGCGNPQAIADLKPGETVLDLGSGGGFDCFLAGRQVGDTGRVIGVDMTPEMISKARANADKGGYGNVAFRLGEIEHLPVADSSVDVILSNCVINLSPDKPQVYRDAFRVLRPGGRLAISDVVTLSELPDGVKGSLDAYCGCVAGAITAEEVEALLHEIGFVNIAVEVKHESREFIRDWFPGSGLEEFVRSATIEARKP